MTSQGNERQPKENAPSNAEKLEFTNLNSIGSLIERIDGSVQARARFVASHVDKGIAYQIRALRDRQDLSQEGLAEMVGMNQNAISRLESPERGRPTITTLKRLAEAFDVALVVRFVPHSQHLKWVSGMPYVDSGLSTNSLAPPKFEEEKKEGVFASLSQTTGLSDLVSQSASAPIPPMPTPKPQAQYAA